MGGLALSMRLGASAVPVVLYGLIVFFVSLLAFLSAFRIFFPASSVVSASFALAFSVLVFFPTASFAFSVLLFPSFAIAVLLLVDRVLVANGDFAVLDGPLPALHVIGDRPWRPTWFGPS
jgi:hypothetical protein